MQKFVEYMNAVDGTRSWEEMEPLFVEAFHPDATYETADGVLDFAQWREMAKGLIGRGTVISDFELKTSDGVNAVWRLTLTAGEEAPLELAAAGRFSGERVIHVAPTDLDAYSAMVAQSA